jgi:hypothetical protein
MKIIRNKHQLPPGTIMTMPMLDRDPKTCVLADYTFCDRHHIDWCAASWRGCYGETFIDTKGQIHCITAWKKER